MRNNAMFQQQSNNTTPSTGSTTTNGGGSGGGGGGVGSTTTIDPNYLILQNNQEVRKYIQDLSELLNTGLNLETLDICVKLCEAGVHPQALADVVNQIRREISTLDQEEY